MTEYFLGVDIGGTKSHALIADDSGRALGFGVGGAGNYEGVGFDGFVATIQAIIHEALHAAGIDKSRLAGAGFGVAGYDWPSERPLTLKAVSTLALDCPFEVVNDAIVGLLAGSREGWGVAVVAGTGENCWGWNQDRQVGRVTGNGMRLGEYGGASTVVYKAIHEVSKAWSLRGPKTALTQAFITRTGADGEADLLEGLALDKYQISADDARLVFEIAEAGDSVAVDILKWAGLELAGLVNGVIRQLKFEKEEFDVVLVGSMFKGGRHLLDPMLDEVRRLAPGARFVPLEAPPVVGGVFLGMEYAGFDGYAVRRRLVDSTKALLHDLRQTNVGIRE